MRTRFATSICFSVSKNMTNFDLHSTEFDVNFRNKPSIAVGADDRFNLTVLAKNRLEHAYEAQIFVHTPKGIDFEKATDPKGRPVVCTQRKNSDEYKNYDLLTCDLGNPMKGRGASSTLVIQYGTKYFEGPYDNVPIYIKTNRYFGTSQYFSVNFSKNTGHDETFFSPIIYGRWTTHFRTNL